MNCRHIRAILVFVLAATFVAPPLSEMLCSSGCSGGTCETPPPATACDPDETGGCCGCAEPVEDFALADPSTTHLSDECQLCPCFVADQIGDFVVSEGTGKLKLYLYQGLASVLPLHSGLTSGNSVIVFFSGENAHGPPLYQLHHALLI